jgi:DNA repair exonuclease SbcCD ATPase subunit
MAATKNTDTAADEIPRGFNLVAAHLRDITVVLNAIEQQMVERNDMLRSSMESQVQRDEKAITALESATGHEDNAGIEARIARLETAMSAIPNMMDKLTVLMNEVVETVKHPVIGPATLVATEPTNGAAKAIAGRIIEHTVAQVQAQTGSIPGTEAAPQKRGRGRPADPKKCAHPEDKVETLENGLRRCTRCGTVLPSIEQQVREKAAELEVPAEVLRTPEEVQQVREQVAAVKEKLAERIAEQKPAAQTLQAVATNITPIVAERKPAKVETIYKNIDGKMVEVDPETLEPIAKPEPTPEPKVEAQPPEPVKATLDDVRAVAIGYAGKHGKERLGAVLVKYGAGNLSSVPAEKYDALMAELQAG